MPVHFFANKFFIILSKGMTLLMTCIWKILMLLIRHIDLALFLCRIQLSKIMPQEKTVLKTVHPATHEAQMKFQLQTTAAPDPRTIL
jgi:hypothetical protein